MKTVRVDLGRRSYDVLIGSGMFARISRFFSTYGIGRRLFLVSNRPVFQLFGEAILEQLRKAAFEVTEILIPDGEEHKNLETVQKVYTSLVDRKADRSSTLVALGVGSSETLEVLSPQPSCAVFLTFKSQLPCFRR